MANRYTKRLLCVASSCAVIASLLSQTTIFAESDVTRVSAFDNMDSNFDNINNFDNSETFTETFNGIIPSNQRISQIDMRTSTFNGIIPSNQQMTDPNNHKSDAIFNGIIPSNQSIDPGDDLTANMNQMAYNYNEIVLTDTSAYGTLPSLTSDNYDDCDNDSYDNYDDYYSLTDLLADDLTEHNNMPVRTYAFDDIETIVKDANIINYSEYDSINELLHSSNDPIAAAGIIVKPLDITMESTRTFVTEKLNITSEAQIMQKPKPKPITVTPAVTSTETSKPSTVYIQHSQDECLTPSAGVFYGPSGKETWYNLPMGGVVRIMRRQGFDEEHYPYWVREDGVKMLGDYVMVAADLSIRPRGSIVESSLGTALVCDTGDFIYQNPTQLDIAVDWYV